VNTVQLPYAVHFVKDLGYTSGVTKISRREREKAEFREDVLAAARRIVLKEGFPALTMRKIADAIEYSPGTIYLYFESRDEIAFELCHKGFEELYAALSPCAKIRDPIERVRDLGRRYVRFGIENPETYRLLFMEDPKFTSALYLENNKENILDPDTPGMQALGLLVSVFVELRAQNRLNVDDDPVALAEMTWSVVHGITSLEITNDAVPQTPVDQLLERMTDTLLAAWIR
jgi:AcrR family transcriptional regulator